MSEAITIARPYAQAAFDVAQKQNALKLWSDLLISLTELVEQAEVNAAINNPKVSKAQITNLMNDFAGSAASGQQSNFVHVLAENQRLQILPEISALFEVLKAEAEKL